jgi:hypothetical protein
MRAVLIVLATLGCGLAYSQETKPASKELSEKTKATRELRQYEAKLDKWIKDVICKKCNGSGSELATGTGTESLGQFPTGAARSGQYSYSRNRNCSRCGGSGVVGGCDESQRGLELWIDFLQMWARYTSDFVPGPETRKRIDRKTTTMWRALGRIRMCPNLSNPNQYDLFVCTVNVVDVPLEKNGHKLMRVQGGGQDFFIPRPPDVNWCEGTRLNFIGRITTETATYTTVAGSSRTLRIVDIVPYTLHE